MCGLLCHKFYIGRYIKILLQFTAPLATAKTVLHVYLLQRAEGVIRKQSTSVVSPRKHKLEREHRILNLYSPEGIKAQPLDSSYSHWHASITGPVGSPYEGGIFYLNIKFPIRYPFAPPFVTFLTKIFHPNIGSHGDIGMDILHKHSWPVILTISKVLLSIQSLLTDPNTFVCVQPEIGRMYNERREIFDAVARNWTRKFAMCGVRPYENE